MSPRSRLALLVICGYVVVSFCVGNAYPFSIFDMYSHRAENGSRIVARKDGHIEEVDRYLDWSCDGEIDLNPGRCAGEGAIATSTPVEEELVGWVRSHSGTANTAIPIDLLRRTWFFSAGPTRVGDCVLAHCRAVPR